MLKIMLTGGKGFFCSRFTKRYQNGFNIISTDIEDFDITNLRMAQSYIGNVKPDVLIHGAALTQTDFCNKHPQISHDVNVKGAVNVAKACKAHNVKFIFLSTEQVFNGNVEPGPYHEDHKPHPNTTYGKHKLEAERMIQDLYDNVWIVRFAWMFGMPQRGCGMSPNLLWNTLTSLVRNDPIYASPNEYRAVTYVEDMVENINKLLDIPFGCYHFSARNDKNRLDTVKHVLQQMGLSDRIDQILVKEEKQKRDARLCSNKLGKYGLKFEDSLSALTRCINEYSLLF